jgi:hypothetical protein
MHAQREAVLCNASAKVILETMADIDLMTGISIVKRNKLKTLMHFGPLGETSSRLTSALQCPLSRPPTFMLTHNPPLLPLCLPPMQLLPSAPS